MDKRQRQIREYSALPLGYYHLCTDGWKAGKLFNNEREYGLGMSGVALITIKFRITVYAFELMPNHIHIILSGTGAQCLGCFHYLVHRINKKLKEDGYQPLPDDFWFKLIPIESANSLRSHIVYLARNAFEKGTCTPCGHMWGTGYLPYNETAKLIRGVQAAQMSVREKKMALESATPIPDEWEIHPLLGILPAGLVALPKVYELFPTVKDYMIALIKDYESYVRIAEVVDEQIEWSLPEVRDIVDMETGNLYPYKSLFELTEEDKCKIAVYVNSRYHIPAKQLSQSLMIPARVLTQAINSKDYRIPNR